MDRAAHRRARCSRADHSEAQASRNRGSAGRVMVAPAKAKPASVGRDVPVLYRGLAKQAVRSRAAAVKLFCLECVGYVRKDVTECTACQCPLFRHRPYQNGEDDAEGRDASPKPVALILDRQTSEISEGLDKQPPRL